MRARVSSLTFYTNLLHHLPFIETAVPSGTMEGCKRWSDIVPRHIGTCHHPKRHKNAADATVDSFCEGFYMYFFLLCPLCWQLPSVLEPDVDDCYASATQMQLLFSMFPPQIVCITLKSLWHESPSRQPTDFLSKVCLTFKKKHTLVLLKSLMTFLVKPEARMAGSSDPCGSSQSGRTRLKAEVNGDVSINLTHFQQTAKEKN